MSMVVLGMIIVQQKKVELVLLTTNNLQLSKSKTTARNKKLTIKLRKLAMNHYSTN